MSNVREIYNPEDRYMGISKYDWEWMERTDGVVVHHQDETEVYMASYGQVRMLEPDGTLNVFNSWEDYLRFCSDVDWGVPA